MYPSDKRSPSVCFHPAQIRDTDSGCRASGRSVSGMRTKNHIQMPRLSPATTQKMPRQLANNSTVCPNAGAMTGTTMNTMNAIDITRAIGRP